jgi:hypothetical protein
VKPAIGRPRPPSDDIDPLLVVAVCIGLLALAGLYAAACDLVYGDWRCAFAQCRIEV